MNYVLHFYEGRPLSVHHTGDFTNVTGDPTEVLGVLLFPGDYTLEATDHTWLQTYARIVIAGISERSAGVIAEGLHERGYRIRMWQA